MPATEAGEQLTQAHRVAQARHAAAMALLAQRVWSAVVSEQDPIATIARWIELLAPQLVRAQRSSASLARDYIQAFRRVEAPDAGILTLAPWDPTPLDALTTSLRVTSLTGNGLSGVPTGFLKRFEEINQRELETTQRRAEISKALDQVFVQAAGAVIRQTGHGGRDQIVQAVDQDRVALGFARVTKADPCFFCAMLASRPPVYKADSFSWSNDRFDGDGKAKAHDNCGCSLEPVYDSKARRPGRGEEFWGMWLSMPAGLSGPAAMKEFRRIYEGRA